MSEVVSRKEPSTRKLLETLDKQAKTYLDLQIAYKEIFEKQVWTDHQKLERIASLQLAEKSRWVSVETVRTFFLRKEPSLRKAIRGKRLVFRIRQRYFDAIVSGEKQTEFRPDHQFWRSRIDGKMKEGDPDWIAVFICGKRVHRRIINLIQMIDTPTWFSEQGKKDVDTQQCYAIHLGKEVAGLETQK